eukprot:scaffold148015_cov35-Attheya_sp.AAC.1
MLERKDNAVLDREASDASGSIRLGGWQRLYLNNNHHSGSAIWMEMTRNVYRLNLEGWSLSRVAMVIFGSGLMVALHPI